MEQQQFPFQQLFLLRDDVHRTKSDLCLRLPIISHVSYELKWIESIFSEINLFNLSDSIDEVEWKQSA